MEANLKLDPQTVGDWFWNHLKNAWIIWVKRIAFDDVFKHIFVDFHIFARYCDTFRKLFQSNQFPFIFTQNLRQIKASSNEKKNKCYEWRSSIFNNLKRSKHNN